MTDAYRMYASLSFVGVLIIIGVPLWWKTTEVYRVSLPYGKIADLDKFPFKLSMTIQLAVLNQTRGVQMKRDLQDSFAASDNFNLLFDVIPRPSRFHPSPDILEKMDRGAGTLMMVEWPLENEEVKLTLQRIVLYSPTAPMSTLVQVLSDWLLSTTSLHHALKASSYSRHDEATRRRTPPSSSFDVTLTVVVPKPEKITVDWSPKDAIQDYLEPFVSELSLLHNFTLKSQWLFFLELNFNPKQVLDDTVLRRHYLLSEATLPHLITPLEKRLGSHVSKNPCLNLVLYIPSCDHAPIHIYNKNGVRVNGKMDTFISPRWGGIVLGNPTPEVCVPYLENPDAYLPLHQPDTKEVMGYFLAQLRMLLGIPQPYPILGAAIEPLTTPSLRKWELDALIRIRTVEQVVSAKLTLKSLAQLLGEISNIVINDDVGASIYSAVENVERTDQLMKEGRMLEALETSRMAFLAAEAAFTDPTLLALLYFPDDQKYAVYMPLYLPIMIPVIMSLKNIMSWLKQPNTKDKTE